MKIIKSLVVMLLLSLAVLSCTNPADSANSNNEPTVLPTEGKTIIVDVRTTGEWINDGHANCSVNYPLDELSSKIDSLRNYDKIIVVCRSGNRSAAAKEMLEEQGLKNIENKGAWQNINCK
ncbi:MAG TPA: rhodanese-like domain-containing protein [Ferruginibacter sp.]|nr:rhodanese-like domain-containing protein [Ferruginibacter sp.]